MKTATGLTALYIRWRDCKAATLWWGIYALPGFEDNKSLAAHEGSHWTAMLQEGRLVYSIKYCYYWLRYGYQNNPYEVAARLAALNIKE